MGGYGFVGHGSGNPEGVGVGSTGGGVMIGIGVTLVSSAPPGTRRCFLIQSIWTKGLA